MADFTILPGKFRVRVNDAREDRVFEIEADSVENALAEAGKMWAMRHTDEPAATPASPAAPRAPRAPDAPAAHAPPAPPAARARPT